MATYEYQISGIFNNVSPNLSQLYTEINASLVGLVGILQNGDLVKFEFVSSIVVQDLETLLTNHVANFAPPKINNFTYVPRKNCIKSTTYERLGGAFKYGGSTTDGTINYIEVVCCKDSDVTSFDCRIYDLTNNAILAEKTGITNDETAFIDLGTISNIPSNPCLLELHVKKVGGSDTACVHVEQVVIYVNN